MKPVSAKVERRGPARHRLGPPRLLRDLAVGRKGAVVIIVAVAMIPLLLAAGGAIDVARFYVAKSRVQYALDAALLAAGASDPTADRTKIFDDYFNANFPASSVGQIQRTPPDFSNPTTSVFNASVNLKVPTVFLYLASIDVLETNVAASVVRQTTGVELALVLDTTGSMFDPAQAGGTTTKLDDLKTAATELLDIVFAGEMTSPTVKVAVIPFVTAVNIGTGNSSFVRFPTPDHEYPTNFDTFWRGCVLARRNGNDVLDTYTPSHATAGEWEPYFWEAESYYQPAPFLPGKCTNRWWRPDTAGYTLPPRPTGRSGDPLFSTVPGSFTDEGLVALTDPDPDSTLPVGSPLGEGVTRGPNKACPAPITPLTNDRATVQTAVDGLQGLYDSGTAVPMGAVWGWRVLSPSEPFTEGVAYSDPNINKVMIIMTDGDNVIETVDFLNCTNTSAGRHSSHYTGYGYTSELRLGPGTVNPVDAAPELDNRLATACANINDAGITIFTITFGGSLTDTIRDLMESCASSPSNYYDAPTGAQLQAAFQAIGARLTSLRIAQ